VRRARRGARGFTLIEVLVALAICASAAPGASPPTSTGNAFNELTESQTESGKAATTATTTRSSSSETTNSQTLIILALVAAVLLLVGIAFVIARDARKVAPADVRSASAMSVRAPC